MPRALLVAALAALLSIPAAGGAAKRDYAAVALNVLPPGQSGSLRFPANASDQIPLYDGLTPKLGNVSARDLTRYFKPERFGVTGKVVRVERPRRGVRIERDRWGVPHVYGTTRANLEFGAGYATAEDRFVLMELLRGPGRLAALDVAGPRPVRARDRRAGSSCRPRPPTIGSREQLSLIRSAGAKGRQLVADVTSYVAGINTYYTRLGQGLRPWTTTDVIAVGSLLGANLGVGGGDEIRRSLFLNALQHRLGGGVGYDTWRWLAQKDVADAPASIQRTLLLRRRAGAEAGQRRARRRQLPAQRRRLAARVPLPQSRRREQRVADRRGPLGDEASAARRRAAGRLHVSRAPARARPARRRDRRARCVVPRPQLLRPHRPREGLRLEPDLRELGHRRPVRRDAVRRRRRALHVQRRVPRDDDVRRGRAQRERDAAGPADRVPRDGARPCRRLRDGGRTARRAVDAALDARPRAAVGAGVPGSEHEPRPRSAELLPRDEPARVHVQLVLRRRQEHRDVLERSPAGARA